MKAQIDTVGKMIDDLPADSGGAEGKNEIDLRKLPKNPLAGDLERPIGLDFDDEILLDPKGYQKDLGVEKGVGLEEKKKSLEERSEEILAMDKTEKAVENSD